MHLLSKIHVAGAMNRVLGQKVQISIRKIQDFAIVMISKFVLLATFYINPYIVDFLIVVSKLLIPKLAYNALALHRHG